MTDEIRTGAPDAEPDTTSHDEFTREGNEMGRRGKDDDHSDAARSTSIRPEAEDPIDPEAPNISPA
ncbi:MAG: hypothetical protein JO086_01110 [Acidimicrobiia bacterium]|nr:hypothetical protein [Acidimicrobiia bacterium]